MVTVKADNKKRVVIPDAKPGQVFLVISNADGSRTLLPKVDPPELPPAKVHFVKEDGYSVLVSDRPVDEAALKAALEDFP